DFALAYSNLGNALSDQRRLDEAVAAYRKAIDLKPDLAEAHNNLGIALGEQKKPDEAVAAYRRAIQIRRDYAEAHCNLGCALCDQGRFAEGLAELREGDKLGSKQPGWNNPSAQWVRTAEALVDLDARLPAILHGEQKPKDNRDRLSFAVLCVRYKK